MALRRPRVLPNALSRRNVSFKWAGGLGLTREIAFRIKMRAACISVDSLLPPLLPAHRTVPFETAAAWKKSSRNKRNGNETNSTSRGVYIKEWPRGRKRERRLFVWIATANRMQNKTVGLLSAIHHVPISR